MFVTDGVVENRRRGLDEGMELLQAVVEECAAAGAEKLVERITEELCHTPEDDCCIVVLERELTQAADQDPPVEASALVVSAAMHDTLGP